MRKANDIKSLKKLFSGDICLSPEVQELVDGLLKCVRDLNNDSMNDLEYNISFNPIIGENTIKDVEGTFICSPNISLFKFSTLTDFHLISSTKEYEVLDMVTSTFEDGIRTDESVSFRNSFYSTSSQYKDIVEDKIVRAFISNERNASSNNRFQAVIADKKKKLGIK